MSEQEFQNIVLKQLSDLTQGMHRLETDVSGLKTDVSGLKTNVTELKTNVIELKQDVSGLKADISALKEDSQELKRRISSIEEQTGGLLEWRYLVDKTLNEIKEERISFFELLGEHDIQIRSLRRKKA